MTRTLNLGILAHVDAGKTTLTERLLHCAGVLDDPGSVDAGTTRTDSLALERRRGITIKAAVVSIPLAGGTVNVVDTPGHPDFIAEVERSLAVLDAAVLVLSAVEGVQPQTRILFRALQRLGVPTLLFVNKLDRSGASLERVLAAIRSRLTPDVLPLGLVAGSGLGARFVPYRPGDAAFRDRATLALAEHDDRLLAAYVEGRLSSPTEIGRSLTAQTRTGVLHPVYAGCATTGAGVPELMAGIAQLLPDSAPRSDGSASGRVFKVERGGALEKLAYVRMFDGELRVRQRIDLPGGRFGKVGGLAVHDGAGWVPVDRLGAGQVGRVRGLATVRVGDGFGTAARAEPHHFPPPTLESSVTAVDPARGSALRTALEQLADQDPLIDVRPDDDGCATVSLYGRVQQEVIGATLADEHGIEVRFADATVLHVERPRRTGQAVLRLNTDENPYQATIGLRIAPGRPGSGFRFVVEAPARDMPLYLFKSVEGFSEAIERHVRRSLSVGRYGWEVTDCAVTLTECAYSTWDGPPSRRGPTSTSYDYRQVTPTVVRQALERAGTVVCEPVLRVTLEVPTEATTGLQRLLGRWGAEVTAQTGSGELTELEARLVATRLHELQRQLPDLTGGEGVLETRFDDYRPVKGRPVKRRRSTQRPAG